MKSILITGAKGFIGSSSSKYFKSKGYNIYGIGHGDLSINESTTIGLDYWIKSEITVSSLKDLNKKFDVIIHCAGSGSVNSSIENPYEDFQKTVNGTLEVLEYMRLFNSSAKLIYPSSPAIHGESDDVKIQENFKRSPVSPYGFHKKIVEDLCQSYATRYDLNIKILRLFSVYGKCLKKQLLWDTCNKLQNNQDAKFWGSGQETRDFIHILDVMKIIDILIVNQENFLIINVGTGIKHTIEYIVNFVNNLMNTKKKITFNGEIHEGNPLYYWADTDKIKTIGDIEFIKIEDGILEYVTWYKNS